MKNKIAVLGAGIVSFVAPYLAMAQTASSTTAVCTTNTYTAGIQDVICRIYSIIKIIIPVLILGAVAYFIWGIIQFVIAGDAEEKSAGRTMMINGIIGFAVILGLWGLVNILLSTFGVGNSAGPGILPTF